MRTLMLSLVACGTVALTAGNTLAGRFDPPRQAERNPISLGVGQSIDLPDGQTVVRYAVAAVRPEESGGVRLQLKAKLISWRDSYHVRLTPAIVEQFRRIGVTDLASHFEKKVVQVRGKPNGRVNGVLGVDFTLEVRDLAQFDSVGPTHE